jgi:hypothetical protein
LATLQNWGLGEKKHLRMIATLAASQNWGKQKIKPYKTLKPQNPTAAGAAELTRV